MASFTDASTEDLLAALPVLAVPPCSSNALCEARVVIVGGSIGGLAAAACLRAAGFKHVQVLERSSTMAPGAGIGLDDASVAVLKGLGILGGGSSQVALQRMRWTEDRLASGQSLVCQPFPYFSIRYSELVPALLNALPSETVKYGYKVSAVQPLPNGGLSVIVAGHPAIECDVVVAADGPRSIFRKEFGLGDENLRFAGYAAWRGVVPESQLPDETREMLRKAFPLFGNCCYFIMGEKPRQSAVLYDIGKGLVNWLIYEPQSKPVAEPGRTTSAATDHDVARLRHTARMNWGDALGAVIEATPDPFWTDVYDIAFPLPAFAKGNVALLGDAAHPITPHMAKGSNLAIHDAFVLGCAAAKASTAPGMLEAYSACRAGEAGRTVLLSRLLGCVRGGLIPETETLPLNDSVFLKAVNQAGIRTTTLPESEEFRVVWKFVDDQLPKKQQGFFLDRQLHSKSLHTPQISRPNFPFGGTVPASPEPKPETEMEDDKLSTQTQKRLLRLDSLQQLIAEKCGHPTVLEEPSDC